MHDPLVSIGLPVYNGAASVRDAIDSALNQSYKHLEIVICDNGSTDQTEAICREYAAADSRIRYFRNERNIGPIGNFRRVLDLARGDYLMWMAADDIKPLNAVASCVAALEQQPSAVMAHGPVTARLLNPVRTEEIANRMDLSGASPYRRVRVFTKGLQHNGMLYGLYRRSAIVPVTLGDHFAQDYLFCLKMCLIGPIAYTSCPIVIYQHRNDAVVGPMYARTVPTLRDLLFCRGVRRGKCWQTLFRGAYYLMRERRAPVGSRLSATAGHLVGFPARYPVHLAHESLFIVFTPVFWALSPLAPLIVRTKARFKRGGFSEA